MKLNLDFLLELYPIPKPLVFGTFAYRLTTPPKCHFGTGAIETAPIVLYLEKPFEQ
jgi:hypothetical protein